MQRKTHTRMQSLPPAEIICILFVKLRAYWSVAILLNAKHVNLRRRNRIARASMLTALYQQILMYSVNEHTLHHECFVS